ncbi:MAG: TolC family protein, partial [Planctomycetales bacterium]|nr:TolC family protein [Planctomycetales bacterium]
QEQYFFFRGRAEEAKRDLLKGERQLRFLMGIEATDGRIIRPVDDPTMARVDFDWYDILAETLTRTPEIRRQKWRVKEQEISLMAAKNNLLPQLDGVALQRFLGLGDELWRADSNQLPFAADGSQAFENMTDGDYQEWRLALEFSMPIGNRQAKLAVRNSQWNLAKAKAVLEDLELELSHSLTDAVQNLDASYQLMSTAAMQGLSAKKQVDALRAQFQEGSVTLDFLLDAQRRLSDAQVAFYRSLMQYNLSIVEVHYRKGSLAEYCGVLMQEGEWPQKAYWDAKIRARQRDASYYLNYGYTRPKVISRGKVAEDGLDASFDPMASTPLFEPSDSSEPTPADTENLELLPGGPTEVPDVDPADTPGSPADAKTLESVLKVETVSAETPTNASDPVVTASSSEAFDWGALEIK